MQLNEMLRLYATLKGEDYEKKQNMRLLFEHTVYKPEGVDMDALADTIIIRCGTLDTIVTSTDEYVYVHNNFFARWLDNIERMVSALSAEYNPLHNYDREEESTDTNTGTRKNTGTSGTKDTANLTDSHSGTDTNNTQNGGSNTTTNEVSAYNQTGFTNDSKSTTADDRTTNVTSTYNSSVHSGGDSTSTRTDDLTQADDFTTKHVGRIKGNIGVTTSQQMLQSEVDLRHKSNIYNIIADMYANECLLSVW